MESTSFTALVESNLRLARWYAVRWKRRLGLNQQDFEDAEQEACMALIHAAQHCDPTRPFAPYAATCCDHALARWAQQRASESTNHNLPEPASHAPDRPDAIDLLEVLRQLPLTLRQVLMLRYGLGGEQPHTLRETAKTLSLSHQQIAILQREALESLRTLLDTN